MLNMAKASNNNNDNNSNPSEPKGQASDFSQWSISDSLFLLVVVHDVKESSYP